MNAVGHVAVAMVAEGPEELWDVMCELAERAGKEGPGLHGFAPDASQPRFCLHPTSEPRIELRGDDLRKLLFSGAMYLAGLLDESEMWRRDG